MQHIWNCPCSGVVAAISYRPLLQAGRRPKCGLGGTFAGIVDCLSWDVDLQHSNRRPSATIRRRIEHRRDRARRREPRGPVVTDGQNSARSSARRNWLDWKSTTFPASDGLGRRQVKRSVSTVAIRARNRGARNRRRSLLAADATNSSALLPTDKACTVRNRRTTSRRLASRWKVLACSKHPGRLAFTPSRSAMAARSTNIFCSRPAGRRVDARLVRRLHVASTAEHCVADDAHRPALCFRTGRRNLAVRCRAGIRRSFPRSIDAVRSARLPKKSADWPSTMAATAQNG